MGNDVQEEGVEVPWERIDPETLRKMIGEFVSREWAELSDAGYGVEEKIGQVLRQLQEGKARVVFDFRSDSWDIVVKG